MENKDLIIIASIVIIIYLYYQPNISKLIRDNSQVIQDLEQQVQHYQSLYQKRVAKDLDAQTLNSEWEIRYNQLENLNNQTNREKNDLAKYQVLIEKKVEDLEKQLVNLAKQKIKGKKDAERLLSELESNWQQNKAQWEEKIQGLKNQLTNQQNLMANKDHFIKTLETNLTQNKQQLEKVNQELTAELKKNQELTAKCQEISQLEQARLTLEAEATHLQQEIKELTEDHEKTKTGSLEKLRKINVLFDSNANDYERIDFEGLYSLLEKIQQKQNLTQQTKTNLLNKIDNYLSQEK